MIVSMDNQEFDIDGTMYIVRNIGGSAGRKVYLLDGPDNLPNTGDESGDNTTNDSRQQTQPTVAELRDAIRAVMDAWEVKCVPGDGIDVVSHLDGDHVNITLDLFVFDPGQVRTQRENEFIADLQAVCERFNAAPMNGGFMFEGQEVTL
jgi:hypothetical protein